MARIFISYRRDDTSGQAGRLHDALNEQFGHEQVFRDISDLEPGVDFVEAIEAAVGTADVALILIGRHWLDASDRNGHRRLDDPNDFVRLEVAGALARSIRVIPVLVQGAAMPSEEDLPPPLVPLTRRQAYELSENRWEFDVDRLVAAIDRALGDRGHRAFRLPWRHGRKSVVLPALVGSAIVAALVGAYALMPIIVPSQTPAPTSTTLATVAPTLLPAPPTAPQAAASAPTTAPALPTATQAPTLTQPSTASPSSSGLASATVSPPPAAGQPSGRRWIVVLGADNSPQEAQYEIDTASKLGLPPGKIYLWRRSAADRQWYVPTMGPYGIKADADRDAATASAAIGRAVGVENLATWCAQSVARSGYEECTD